jgi:hypothetical protein
MTARSPCFIGAEEAMPRRLQWTVESGESWPLMSLVVMTVTCGLKGGNAWWGAALIGGERNVQRRWSAINGLSTGRVMAAVSDAGCSACTGGEQTQLGKQIGVLEGEHCGHMARTRRHESRAGSALHMHVARVRSRHR